MSKGFGSSTKIITKIHPTLLNRNLRIQGKHPGMSCSNPRTHSKAWRITNRKSLAPPGRMPTTWEEYVGAAPGAAPPLGRAQILKQNEKHFTAIVGMSEDFPMGVEVLLDILEIVAPFKHLEKLRRFCEARLPPGFPVRVEIPLLPTISAKVTFQKLQFVSNLSEKLFYVPTSYREDPTRFPDL